MFPRHDDFAVRTIGLPGMIGALGACFGRVVTHGLARRRGQPGEFNWGATLWHELAHVITLQLSNQRIPRWLTEGISVFEEKRARPEWGREMDIPFARAIESGETMKLRDLNAGFQNPANDFARLLRSVARSSNTSSRSTASRSCARWCSRSPTASTPKKRSSGSLGVDIDALQRHLRRLPRRAIRRAAQGARRAAKACRATCRSTS